MSVLKGIYGEKKKSIVLQSDATSLADLKAETMKKRNEANLNKQKGNFKPERNVERKGATNIWSRENSGLIARMQKDMEQNKEEEQSWAKSKAIMERKARIYKGLREGKGRSEVASNFLVKFDDKSSDDSDSDDGRRYRDEDYPAKEDGDEWVEYTDALGRTRTCMRKDLKRLKEKDKDITRRREDVDNEEAGNKRKDKERPSEKSLDEPDLLSEDMRREMMREKWEKEEMENLTKDSLHYSDVRFDEARTHGAGFYAFSRDEQKRQKEQEELKKLHEDTKEARKEKERKMNKRQKEMAERIKKIKQRRREKLGLPPLPDDADEADNQAEGKGASDVDDDITESVVAGLKMFRKLDEEEERRKNEVRRLESVRDWDKDKEELGEEKNKEWRVLTQKEWLDRQRQERKQEFAPPSAYNEARTFLKAKEEAFIKTQENKRKLAKEVMVANIVQQQQQQPPPSFQAVGNFSRPPLPIQTGPFIPQSAPGPPPPPSKPSRPRLDPMAMLEEEQSERQDLDPPSVPPPSSYSTAMRLELHKRMETYQHLPQPGINNAIINQLEVGESDGDSDENELEEAEARRGQRAELAPPCEMDYYNSSSRPAASNSLGKRSHEDMAAAFSAGLQARKKKH